MAQADGWPQSDVKADLEVNPSTVNSDIPSEHGAAADKYYQLLSLHGDTVSVSLHPQNQSLNCRSPSRTFVYRRQDDARSQNYCSLLVPET